MVTREFQYKLLHNIIFCNDKLYLFGLTQSNVCFFCRKEVETYRFIFFECCEGSRIWNEVGNNLKMFQFLNMQWIDMLLGFMFCPSPFFWSVSASIYISLFTLSPSPPSLSLLFHPPPLSPSLSCLASLLFYCSVSLCPTQLKLDSWIDHKWEKYFITKDEIVKMLSSLCYT